MRSWTRVLRSFAVALALVVAFALLVGARPVFAYEELRCEEGHFPRPMGLAGGVYQCEQRPLSLPPSVELREVVTVRDEVGLYLTRLDVRVFHIDFVAGTRHGPALGVRLGY